MSSAFIRKPLSKLLSNDYKDYRNYIKQLKKVCALIVERGINIDNELLHELICDSRKANGKQVYYASV